MKFTSYSQRITERCLLPAIHECILDIDEEAKKMTVHLMEGLI